MSLRALQPGLRALDVLDTVPAEHGALVVLDEGFEPHLHFGELAVFNAADREPQHGEIYVVEFRRPGAPRGSARRIAQAWRKAGAFSDGPGVGWWLRFAIEPGAQLVEGPLREDSFRRVSLGRIVAVLWSDDL